MRQAAFLTLLLLGIAALLGGLLRARANWRSDVPRYGRRTQILGVMFHPERYAMDSSLGGIRALNCAGALLLAGAIGTLVYEAFRSISAR
jgi:hypothetical protein